MPTTTSPDWDLVLSAAVHLQQLLPETVLVGGTAAAVYAKHRVSTDADHVLTNLRERFDQVLQDLESVAGWRTARVNRPVLILGSLDGIETGIRQLIRTKPLKTTEILHRGERLTLPTEAEILRIKGVLILKRNSTRDYLDFAALADRLGDSDVANAFRSFDELYPSENDQSALQQLQVQLANALPFDLERIHLGEYKQLAPKWHDWDNIRAACARVSIVIFDELEPPNVSGEPFPPS